MDKIAWNNIALPRSVLTQMHVYCQHNDIWEGVKIGCAPLSRRSDLQTKVGRCANFSVKAEENPAVRSQIYFSSRTPQSKTKTRPGYKKVTFQAWNMKPMTHEKVVIYIWRYRKVRLQIRGAPSVESICSITLYIFTVLNRKDNILKQNQSVKFQ